MEVLRIPSGGVQPEIAVDKAGVAHMVYLAGDPAPADVFYVRTSDRGPSFGSRDRHLRLLRATPWRYRSGRAADSLSLRKGDGQSRHLFANLARPRPDVHGRSASQVGDRRVPNDEHVDRRREPAGARVGNGHSGLLRYRSFRAAESVARVANGAPPPRRKHPRIAVNREGLMDGHGHTRLPATFVAGKGAGRQQPPLLR